MSENKEGQNITSSLTLDTKREECVKIVKQLLTPDEKKSLGDNTAADKVVESMSYLGSFAPAPATFDKEAFLFTAVNDLPKEEQEVLWNVCNRIGVAKDESSVGNGRVSVPEDLVRMLSNPNNGYFTED